MEYAIIGILVVILILIIVLIIKVDKNREEDISLSKVEGDIIKEIGDFKLNFSRDLMEDFNKLNDRIILKKLIKLLHQF